MIRQPLDLDPESRTALELDALLEAVAGLARTSLGRREVLGSVPSASREELLPLAATVDEAARYLRDHGPLIDGTLPDPEGPLERVAIAGARAEPAQLRDLATLAEGSSRTRHAVLLAAERGGFPRLQAIVAPLNDLSGLAAGVFAAVGPDGRIQDGASPELARVRRELARLGERLRRLLEGVVREAPQRTGVQDAFVTQRNGRFVIPVRTDAHAKVRGIVHASSSSGATLFVEPFESVELNNDLVTLTEQEREEEFRVLNEWTARLRGRIDDLRRAGRGMALLDALQARVLWGERNRAALAEISPDGRLELDRIRHPLLDLRLHASGGECVPFDVLLEDRDRALVLSGPNAGGKTVVLKTIGLAALQAALAIPVSARRAVIPLYAAVRADIGDHQSLEADLSTFSAHLRAIQDVLIRARPPALLLFDEIGTGTDPVEGSAIAQAVLERLLDLGVTAVATTHHGAVKSWAYTTPGVVSAALEFDDATMRPTYRVRLGEAGTSAGIEIAERLGLDPRVVRRARDITAGGGGRTEEYIRRLRESADALEAERAAVEAERIAVLRERERAEARLDEEVRRVRDEGALELDRVVRELRDAARRDAAAVDDEVRREIERRERQRADQRLRAAGEAAKREFRVRAGWSDAGANDAATPWTAAPGRLAWVRSIGREGEIVALRGARAEVRLGAVTFTVEVDDLGPPMGGGSRLARSSPRPSPRPIAEPTRDDERELDLLGRTVEEAEAELERFLNDAVLAGREEVRVIHGHGTGRLRRGVREFLRGHPLVATFRPGGPGEGGDGATVVMLSPR